MFGLDVHVCIAVSSDVCSLPWRCLIRDTSDVEEKTVGVVVQGELPETCQWVPDMLSEETMTILMNARP